MHERLEDDNPTGVEGGDGLQGLAVRGAAWALLQTWGSRVMSMVVVVVLARLLSPADFGLVALGSVFVEFGYWLADGGFGKAIVARREIDDDLISTTTWTAIMISLTLFGSVPGERVSSRMCSGLGEWRFVPGDAGGGIMTDMAVPFVSALRGDAHSGVDLGPGRTGGQRLGDLGLSGGVEFCGLRAELGDAVEMTVHTRNHPINRG